MLLSFVPFVLPRRLDPKLTDCISAALQPDRHCEISYNNALLTLYDYKRNPILTLYSTFASRLVTLDSSASSAPSPMLEPRRLPTRSRAKSALSQNDYFASASGRSTSEDGDDIVQQSISRSGRNSFSQGVRRKRSSFNIGAAAAGRRASSVSRPTYGRRHPPSGDVGFVPQASVLEQIIVGSLVLLVIKELWQMRIGSIPPRIACDPQWHAMCKLPMTYLTLLIFSPVFALLCLASHSSFIPHSVHGAIKIMANTYAVLSLWRRRWSHLRSIIITDHVGCECDTHPSTQRISHAHTLRSGVAGIIFPYVSKRTRTYLLHKTRLLA